MEAPLQTAVLSLPIEIQRRILLYTTLDMPVFKGVYTPDSLDFSKKVADSTLHRQMRLWGGIPTSGGGLARVVARACPTFCTR